MVGLWTSVYSSFATFGKMRWDVLEDHQVTKAEGLLGSTFMAVCRTLRLSSLQ